MPEIIITTLNARYIHASLGARYLYANMGELQPDTEIQEYIINSRPIDIAEKLLESSPKIIGIGVYIWNTQQTTELVALIKTISPETTVVLGGPEISYETEKQTLYKYADFVITGLADLSFAELCNQILSGRPPLQKIINAPTVKLDQIKMPYDYFTDEDIANRVIYVEASRGCPFKCEFCLSSLDKTAWPFNLDEFLVHLDKLYQRGVRQFKFVDRTFNLKIETSIKILTFFLDFELIPDHLPEKLKDIIKQFPTGSLQFEIGIQSFDDTTQQVISRKQDNIKTNENIKWLINETTAHLHTDLIVGLPGETMQQFSSGFNRLVALNPHEIQVGILKRLRGTPIIRHTNDYLMKYNPVAPYNILSNNVINFHDMQRMSRFSRYWDLIANSGRFKNSLPVILDKKPFDNFLALSDWLFESSKQTHKISLNRLFTFLFDAMTTELTIDEKTTTDCLMKDYTLSGLKGNPSFQNKIVNIDERQSDKRLPKRQQRHL